MAFSTILYEDFAWQRLQPLVYMRPVFQLVCGMDDLLAKVRRLLGAAAPVDDEFGANEAGPALELWCRPGIAEMTAQRTGLPVNREAQGEALLLNGRGYWRRLPELRPGEGAWVGTVGTDGAVACVFADAALFSRLSPAVLLDEARARVALAGLPRRDVSDLVKLFDWPWQIVHANAEALVADWRSRVSGVGEVWDLQWSECEGRWSEEAGDPRRIYGKVYEGSYLLAREAIYVGRGAKIKPCTVIDAEEGPVWIGDNVTIQPHCYVQGPAYIGDGSLLQPGAVVREGTTIGPGSKVGGEIEESIIHGFSNKQHDGFLGHSYVGSWVNIAADCINSDLKNTYGTVRVPINGREVETGEMFVGMLVGDYSKAGINVSFPTGAVMGFCSSVFAPRSPKFVPSFAWINGDAMERYDEQRGLAIARKVMARRKRTMTAAEEEVFLGVRQAALAIEHEPQSRLAAPPADASEAAAGAPFSWGVPDPAFSSHAFCRNFPER